MAERRMFAKSIIDSDAFLDMPLSTQALYFHLSMRADDEGFVGNPKKIQRMIGASDDDCRILAAKRFILTFQSGIIVIKHWRIHNYIRDDRLHKSTYVEEKATLSLDEKGSYTERSCQSTVSQLSDKCQSTDGQMSGKWHTEDNIGKVNINKASKKEYKENNLISKESARARESYEDIMEDLCLEKEVKPIMWEFIKHCQLNGKTLTNDKLSDILVEMDLQNLSPTEKISTLHAAISGGYYDIKRR